MKEFKDRIPFDVALEKVVRYGGVLPYVPTNFDIMKSRYAYFPGDNYEIPFLGRRGRR